MIIDKHFMERLLQERIKNSINLDNLVENYLYISDYKIIFINKYRNKIYHIYASAGCHLEPIKRESTFDLIYWTEDLQDAITMFHTYIMKVFSLNELYKSDND